MRKYKLCLYLSDILFNLLFFSDHCSSERLRMDYGGSDITRCFHWLLTRAGLPIKDVKINNRIDALFLQELKESYCHLDQVFNRLIN